MNTLHKRDALLVIRDFYSKPGKCVWNNDRIQTNTSAATPVTKPPIVHARIVSSTDIL